MAILSDPAARRLGQELAALRSKVDTLEAAATSTQLGDSTLYGAIYIADPDGNVKGIVGEQADGSTGVVVTGGPNPPAPTGLSLTPLMSGVDLGWAGTFAQAKPLNFSHVNAYLSDAGAGFVHGPSNLVGTLSDAGTIPVAPLPSGTQWWARLVAVNDSVPPGESPASVTVGPVTPDQVVAQDVLDGIVTEVKIAQDAVTAAKIAAGAVGTGEIAGQAVTLSQLSSGSVDATKLVSGAVTQPAIATSAVTANAIAANSVIAGKIAADAVTANTIAAGSVQATQIAAGAVLTDKLAADSVTAAKIASLAVTADSIAANAINAGHITAGAVTASKLAATLVLGTTIIAGTSTTGARVQLNGGGIEAYRSNGQKVLDFDTTSGDMTIAGRYRSADGGSRVEINPGGNAPDEIRMYRGSTYAYINAEPAPNNTAAIVMRSQVVNSRMGSVGCYPAESFLAYQTSGGTSLAAISCVDGGADIWSNGVISLMPRNSNGRVDFLHDRGHGMRLEYRPSDASEPQLFAPGRGTALTFAPFGLYVSNGGGQAKDIVALNVVASSSRKIKKREREFTGSARAGLAQVGPKWFNYDTEWAEGEPRPAAKIHQRVRQLLDSRGRPRVDPVTQKPLTEIQEIAEPEQNEPTRPHLGLIAEEVQAVLPDLVRVDPNIQGGLGILWNDVIAYGWQVDREQEAELRSLRADVDDLKRRRPLL